MSRKLPGRGDYVLATKYHDGNPGDQFSIGFYDRAEDHFGQVRHFVIDNNGEQFRRNGFRRVDRISDERGRWLIARFPEIERSGKSLWWWRFRRIRPNPSHHFPTCESGSDSPPDESE